MQTEHALQSLGRIRHVLPLEVAVGDFLYLHTKHFQTFGIVIREPSRLLTDPFNDVFEIVDGKGNLVWGRAPSVKFFYPSMLAKGTSNDTQPIDQDSNKEAFIRTAYAKLKAMIDTDLQTQLTIAQEDVIQDWAHSLGDQLTFNLWDAYQVLTECQQDRRAEFRSLFSIFQFLYTKSLRIVRDTAYRVNGPFAHRKQSQQLLLERCQAHFSDDNRSLLYRFKGKLLNPHSLFVAAENSLESDLIEGMKNVAYCTFENSQNNPFQFIAKRLAIARRIKTGPEMHDFLSTKGLVPPLLNPRLVESNLELEHPPSACAITIGTSSRDPLLHEYRYNESIRHEYTNAPVFTIDSLRASEIDDGISVDLPNDLIEQPQHQIDVPGPKLESLWFHVHIADCVSFYNTSDQVDLIGRRMVNSVYLPEQTFPMLPWKITQLMSLEPGKQENFCLTFSFRLNSTTGDLLETRIAPVLVPGRQICKITYDSVDIGQSPHLNTIYQACLLHRKFRDQKGHISVEFPQPHIWLKHHPSADLQFRDKLTDPDSGQPLGPEWNAHSPLHFAYQPLQAQTENERIGHFIVSEMMIIAGRVASEFCRQRNLFIPYRFQQLNPNWTPAQIEKWTVKDNDTPPNSSLVDAYLYTRTALPAEYGLTPQRHISMGLDCYAKVTSPIRRYVDQLVHQQIKSWILHECSPLPQVKQRASLHMLDPHELSKILRHVNERELRTKWLQRSSARFWVLQYLSQIQRGLANHPHFQPCGTGEIFVLTGTVVYYNELLRLYYIFLDYWNIPIIHREEVLQLELGMKVDLQVLENEPMKFLLRVQIVNRHLS